MLHPCHNPQFPPRDCDCHFGVSAPSLNDSCWVNDAFNLYAMDIERQRERAAAIEKFINYLANTDDPNDTDNQWDAVRYSGINEFSPAEQEYVENEVAKRWQENM